jgi:hypothetical protein
MAMILSFLVLISLSKAYIEFICFYWSVWTLGLLLTSYAGFELVLGVETFKYWYIFKEPFLSWSFTFLLGLLEASLELELPLSVGCGSLVSMVSIVKVFEARLSGQLRLITKLWQALSFSDSSSSYRSIVSQVGYLLRILYTWLLPYFMLSISL